MNRLLRYFEYNHLPEGPMRATSGKCAELAIQIDCDLEESALSGHSHRG